MAVTKNIINHNIRLAFFNANGIKRQKLLFIQFLKEHNIDIALLSETFLKPNVTFKIRNYTVIRTDRTTGKKGGTAVIIKSCLPYQPINLPQLETLEATAIKLLTTKEPITIISVYKSPPKELQLQDLRTLSQLNKHIIIAGDINAKNPLWNSTVPNDTGRRLEIFANQLNLQVDAPTTPTHYPIQGGRPDVLDTCIYSDVNILSGPTAIDDLQSDHLPVKIEIYYRHCLPIHHPPKNAITDWDLFRTHVARDTKLLQPPTTILEAEENVQQLTKIIKDEFHKHTTYLEDANDKESKQHIISTLTQLKKFIRRKWQNTRHPAFKSSYNCISKNSIHIFSSKK